MTAMPPVTVATLAAFSDAWNRHDIDALMSFMTDDCVFETAAGPDACGTRHVGREAVRRAFESAWQAVPDAQWRNGQHFVHGDFGVSQWTFTGTAAEITQALQRVVDPQGSLRSQQPDRRVPRLADVAPGEHQSVGAVDVHLHHVAHREIADEHRRAHQLVAVGHVEPQPFHASGRPTILVDWQREAELHELSAQTEQAILGSLRAVSL